MIELELTYLAKFLPEDLKECKHKEIIDVYLPKNSDHPKLRLRKSGDKYEMTKKQVINAGDASEQTEETIILTEEEFNALNEQLEGKRVHKLRYYYDHNGKTAEFDVFQGDLLGLVVIDFEFETNEEKSSFEMPDFCLLDVTQELFIAGGMICGRNYSDVKEELARFDYKKLFLE
jgi:adenylate cyclase